MTSPRDPNFDLGVEFKDAIEHLDSLREDIALEVARLEYLSKVADLRPELIEDAPDRVEEAIASVVGIMDMAGEGLDTLGRVIGLDVEFVDDEEEDEDESPEDYPEEEEVDLEDDEEEDAEPDNTAQPDEEVEDEAAADEETGEFDESALEQTVDKAEPSSNGHPKSPESAYKTDKLDYGSRIHAPKTAEAIKHIDHDSVEVIVGVSEDGLTLTIEHGPHAGTKISGIPGTIMRTINLAIGKQGRDWFKSRDADDFSEAGKFNNFSKALKDANGFIAAKSKGAIPVLIDNNGESTIKRAYRTSRQVLFLDHSLIHSGTDEIAEPTPPKA